MASRESAARHEEREMPKSEVRESAPERAEGGEELEVGTRVEVRGLDGSRRDDVFTGSLDLGGQEHQVFARASGRDIRIHIITPEEARARSDAERQLDLFENALEGSAASAVKAAGLKGDAAKEAEEAILARSAEIIAEATGAKDPEKAMDQAVREQAEALAGGETEIEGPSLEDLNRDLTQARQEALGAKNDKQYEAAVARIHALEKAVYERRAALHPEADKEEKQQIADETEGLVELKPNPIFSEGSEAMRARLKALENEKRSADKAKDEMAWGKADEEYKQILAVLPVVETKEQIKELEDELRAIDKAPSKKGAGERYKEADAKRKELMTKLEALQKKDEAVEHVLEEEAEEPVVLAHMLEIGEPYKPGEMLERLMADIKADFEREEAAKKEAEAPKVESKSESHDEEEPVPFVLGQEVSVKRTAGNMEDGWTVARIGEAIPGEPRRILVTNESGDRKNVKVEELIEWNAPDQRTEAQKANDLLADEMLRPDRPPTAQERKEYKDLIDAGIFQSEGDIDVWQRVYDELVAAMDKVGIPLKDEGLPSSWQQIVGMKDTRGWWKRKVFKSPSPRAQMIDKIKDLHYQYIDQGHVDVSEYLQRQKERQAEYNEKMRRAGRF